MRRWLPLLTACATSAAPVRAPVHNDVIANRCAPLLESTGVTFTIAPDAFVTYDEDAPLVEVGRAPGDMIEEEGKPPVRDHDVLVVAPQSAHAFAAPDPGLGVRAYFFEETDLGNGVTARAGASTIVRTPLDDDRFEIQTISDVDVMEANGQGDRRGWSEEDGLVRVVRCSALATARPPDPPDWVPNVPASIVDDATLVSDAGTELRDLTGADAVDLIAIEGPRARVRVEHGGYVFTGWIDASAVQRGADDAGFWDDDWAGPGMYGYSGWWQRCDGNSHLRAGATLFTGAKSEDAVTTLPSVTHEAKVTLIGAVDDQRRIEIDHPFPDIASLVVWVAASDLSSDCR